MSEWLRWKIAYLMDRLPGQCWSNLVDWALFGDGSPWRPIDQGCRTDLERNGGCYCGKLAAASPGRAADTGQEPG